MLFNIITHIHPTLVSSYRIPEIKMVSGTTYTYSSIHNWSQLVSLINHQLAWKKQVTNGLELNLTDATAQMLAFTQNQKMHSTMNETHKTNYLVVQTDHFKIWANSHVTQQQHDSHQLILWVKSHGDLKWEPGHSLRKRLKPEKKTNIQVAQLFHKWNNWNGWTQTIRTINQSSKNILSITCVVF